MPELSVIIATYNVERTIERLLDSLALQAFRDFEIIVIDGGSRDRSCEILAARDAGELAYFVSEPDEGIYDAWNKGVKVARGEWFVFIGADDYLPDADCLQRMADVAAAGRLNYVCGRAQLVDSDGRRVRIYGQPMRPMALRGGMMVAHPGSWHSRVLFESVGNFDTRYRIAGDLDFLIRARHILVPGFLDAVIIDVENAGVSYANFSRSVAEAAHTIRRHFVFGTLFAAYLMANLRLRRLAKRLLMIRA